MQKGIIIILNGVSSAGKSTLSRSLQKKLPNSFFLLPIDIINDISPPKDSSSYNDRFTSDPNPVISAFYGCVKTFSDNGLNVIVDTIFLNETPWSLDNCFNVFPNCDYPILFVHVTCPSEELRRREEKRGDRRIGHGESMLTKLSPQDAYDLTVDTYKCSNEECADSIIESLAHPEKFTTLKTLWLKHSIHDICQRACIMDINSDPDFSASRYGLGRYQDRNPIHRLPGPPSMIKKCM